MIIKRRLFSGPKVLNTRGAVGFINDRNYDEDFNRLGRMTTSQRELHRIGDLSSEIREMNKELNNGRLGKWQHM